MTTAARFTGFIVRYSGLTLGYLSRVGLPYLDEQAVSLDPNEAHQFETLAQATDAANRHGMSGYTAGTYTLRYWHRICRDYKAKHGAPAPVANAGASPWCEPCKSYHSATAEHIPAAPDDLIDSAMCAWEHVLGQLQDASRTNNDNCWESWRLRHGMAALREHVASFAGPIHEGYGLACAAGFSDSFDWDFVPAFMERATDDNGKLRGDWREIARLIEHGEGLAP
jgi:hypothetical protein